MSTETIEEIKIDEKINHETKEPSKYKIIGLNDDVTPMDWVLDVLQKIFRHSESTSHELVLQIHNEGSAVLGIYVYEIAESKVIEATNASRDRGFPLSFRLEEE